MSVEFFIVFVCSILSLLYGGFTIKKILEEPQGSDRMKEIASAIQEGAQAYLNRQYLTISVVGVLIAVILFYLMENPFVSICIYIYSLQMPLSVVNQISSKSASHQGRHFLQGLLIRISPKRLNLKLNSLRPSFGPL